MTIIAYKDGVMAADSCAFVGSLRVKTARPKIRRGYGGALIGFAGDTATIDTVAGWLLSGGHADTRPDMTIDDGDFMALIALPDGTLYRCGSALVVHQVMPPYALGSEVAALVALGAMHAGATVERAVEIAIEHTINVGGPVQVERL